VNYIRRFVLLCVCWFASSLLIAQKDTTPIGTLKIKYTKDFTLTGDGSAPEWSSTVWNVITQRTRETLRKEGWHMPPEQNSAKDLQYETRFKIMYSDKGIYCLFKCEDSVITATLKEDYANLFDEDVVEAFFRTDTIMPVYFEYELSPLNYELPILILNNKGDAMGWKPWRNDGARKTIHAIKINKKTTAGDRFTWTAEFFIPYALLKSMGNVPPAKGTRWRANFYRIDYDRNPVYSSWQLTRENFHDFERFGIIEFD
jgi:hypothetical protein